MNRSIQSSAGAQLPEKVVNLRDCGPEGCDIDWLSSHRREAEIDDVMAFTQFALEEGWGDGLPLIPPTEARVRRFLGQNNRYPDEVICQLPPSDAVTDNLPLPWFEEMPTRVTSPSRRLTCTGA